MILSNLTTEQVYILNVLWSIETTDDLIVWQAMLPVHQQKLVDSLIELIRHEQIEEDLDNSDLSESALVLNKYKII